MNAGSSPSPRSTSTVAGASIILAAIVCVLVACYGLLGPFYYGHFGYHAGEYSTRARHTLRHGALLPGNLPGAAPPTPGTYYVHHPILTHQLVTATFALFGDHEWSVRLAAIAAFLTTFAMLVLLLWRNGGPGPATVAALTFAVVPLHAWYGAHIDPGFPALAALLGGFTCYLAWLRDGRSGVGAGALALLALSEGFEWTPYLVAIAWGVHVVVTAMRRRGRYLTFLPCFVLAALLPAALHVLAVKRAGQWGDLLSAYQNRAAAMEHRAFLTTLGAYAKTLIGLPLLLAVGASLIAHVVRLVRRRSRPEDLVFLCLLAATIAYLEIFRVAVVTHAYRLLFGGTIAALAVADLARSLFAFVRGHDATLRAALPRLRSTVVLAPAAAALFVATVLLPTLPTTWAGLLESRAHGGIPEWRLFDPHLARSLFARTITQRSRLGDQILLHPSFPFRMEIGYELDRDIVSGVRLGSLALADTSPSHRVRPALAAFSFDGLAPDERRALETLMATHPLLQLGPYGLLDLRTSVPGVERYQLLPVGADRRSLMDRYLYGPYIYPTLAPDETASVRGAILPRSLPPWPAKP